MSWKFHPSEDWPRDKLLKYAVACVVLSAVILIPIGLLFTTTIAAVPAVNIGEPVSNISDTAEVTQYESLDPSDKTVFRKSSGGGAVKTESFPSVDYVKLDGQYHPVSKTHIIPGWLPTLGIIGAIIGIYILLIGTDAIAFLLPPLSSWPVIRHIRALIIRLGPIPIGSLTAIAVLALLSSTFLAPTPIVLISEQPVANPSPQANETVHLSELPVEKRDSIRTAIQTSLARDKSNLTYKRVYEGEPGYNWSEAPPKEIIGVEYLRSDGEVYHVQRNTGHIEPILIAFVIVLSIVVGLLVAVQFNEMMEGEGGKDTDGDAP